MDEQDKQLRPQPEGRPSIEWTEQEVEMWGNAFSLGDFELMRSAKEGEGEYVRVRVPDSVEPMAIGIVVHGQRMNEIYDVPLERESQERMKRFIGTTSIATDASESEEAKWIQSFGQFIEVARFMRDRQDPAMQDLRSSVRMLTHQTLVSDFSVNLSLAAVFSWEKYIQEQREKYGQPENLPKDAEAELIAEYERNQRIKELLKGDQRSGRIPRFLVVNSAGREIFRSTPVLNVS